jgi:TetR/AcrR family transcriptional regulator
MPSPGRGEQVEMNVSKTVAAPKKRAPQKRALEKRAAIIEAAIEEFSRYGYAGATIRQIAENAGVLNSLLRHHFPEKDDLWKACADSLFQSFGEEVRRIRQHVEPGVPQLKAVIKVFLTEFVQRPEMGRFVVVDNRLDLSRLTYVTERHLEGLNVWLTASIKIAQEEGAVPANHDPLILMTFLTHAVTALGSRRSQIELTLNKPLNEKVVAEYEALIEDMVFGSRRAGASSELRTPKP